MFNKKYAYPVLLVLSAVAAIYMVLDFNSRFGAKAQAAGIIAKPVRVEHSLFVWAVRPIDGMPDMVEVRVEPQNADVASALAPATLGLAVGEEVCISFLTNQRGPYFASRPLPTGCR